MAKTLTLEISESLYEILLKQATKRHQTPEQMVVEWIEKTPQPFPLDNADHEIAELRELTTQGQGHSKGWHFNREELYEERTLFSR